jgi:hypothetical protein
MRISFLKESGLRSTKNMRRVFLCLVFVTCLVKNPISSIAKEISDTVVEVEISFDL